MITRIEKVDALNFEENIITDAANIIVNGGLVAFPTETVYGLGANGFDKSAILKIFEAKGRPADNPLIFHISDLNQLFEIADVISDDVKKITDVFWPGPLTIVLPKNDKVPIEATAGLNTVAVRMPSNKIAIALIKKANVPIAAPSANRSGKPSPTCGSHVEYDLSGKIDMILDSGHIDIGIESTVLDMTGDVPVILRPGVITKENLEKIIGEIKISVQYEIEDVPKSPGMKYTHYSPNAELYIVSGQLNDIVGEINRLTKNRKDHKIGILASEQTKNLYKFGEVLVAGNRNKPESIIFNLYNCLRNFDIMDVDIIYAESFEKSDIGGAIMNRLKKAAGYKIINAKPANETILFVCTGNTCRSPMAEYLAKDIFKRAELNFNVLSRGISVFSYSSASPNSIKALKKYNISLDSHISAQIEKDDIINAKIVLAMTAAHKNYLLRICDSDNIFTLAEFAGLNEEDIGDPFGGSESEYQKCAEQIKMYIETIARRLGNGDY